MGNPESAIDSLHGTDKQDESGELRTRLEIELKLDQHPRRNALWSKAWDLGHANGLDEVELYYRDLAELLEGTVVITAAYSSGEVKVTERPTSVLRGNDVIAQGPNLTPAEMQDDVARALGWRTDFAAGDSPINWDLVLTEVRKLKAGERPSAIDEVTSMVKATEEPTEEQMVKLLMGKHKYMFAGEGKGTGPTTIFTHEVKSIAPSRMKTRLIPGQKLIVIAPDKSWLCREMKRQLKVKAKEAAKLKAKKSKTRRAK